MKQSKHSNLTTGRYLMPEFPGKRTRVQRTWTETTAKTSGRLQESRPVIHRWLIIILSVVPAGGTVMNGFDGGTVVSPDQAWLNGGKPCGRGGSCPGRGNAPKRPGRQTPPQPLLKEKQGNLIPPLQGTCDWVLTCSCSSRELPEPRGA